MPNDPHDPFRPTFVEDAPIETEEEFRSRASGGMREIEIDEADQRAAAKLRTVAEGSARHPGSAPSRFARYAWPALVLLLALVAWESLAALLQQSSAPTAKDWDDAITELRAQRGTDRPAILVAPHWLEPVARLHLGELMPLRMATLSDVDAYGTVLELSVRGARHPWLQKSGQPAKNWRFGAITLRRYTQQAQKLSYDFTDHVGDSVVTLGSPPKQCPKRGKRFNCDQRARWAWVGPHLAEVAFRPYRCIYAHPVQGKILRLRFPKVPLGSRIVVYTGIDDFDNRKKAKGRVDLKVFVGKRLAGSVSHDNDWPWHRTVVTTAQKSGRVGDSDPAARGRARDVTFEVSTNRGFARTFCFHAEARK